MRVNLAVKDYISMFPDDYKLCLEEISHTKAKLDSEMAEVKKTHGQGVGRMTGQIPAKLFEMIQQKLDDRDMAEFKTNETMRWFYNEHPQFRITQHV